MASKYDELARHLSQQQGATHTMTFSDVANTIGQARLPDSAYRLREWWSNESARASHTQARNGWLAAGWRVETVDARAQTVTFRR